MLSPDVRVPLLGPITKRDQIFVTRSSGAKIDRTMLSWEKLANSGTVHGISESRTIEYYSERYLETMRRRQRVSRLFVYLLDQS